MQIVSTNIAKPQLITINGRQVKTGIFKKPIDQPIFLEKESVRGDEVSNRKVHGGEFKACYLFSADNYEYWKTLYPNFDWHYGMLGENLTVKGLDETKLLIGDIYKVGDAIIEITQPREPCSTFGSKMGSQDALIQFIKHGKPGTYVRVIQEGFVTVNDEFQLMKRLDKSLSIAQFFKLLFDREKNKTHIAIALSLDSLPINKRDKLKKHL